jgi:ankyrin repeat protein
MFFNSTEKTGSSLLTAAYNGCQEIAELIIESGVSIDVSDGAGETPLHKASDRGHLELVKLLIAHDAQVDAKAKDGSTPLYLAASSQHRDVAQLLLDYGAAMESDIAVMLGDLELVKYYLEQKVDANSKLSKGSNKGDSWLITAIGYKYKNAELVKLLLNYGAKVNEKTGNFKLSPLHRVAIVGYKANFTSCRDIGELLIVHGADVNAEDIHGNTPLHWAARFGHQDIVELMLDHNANANALNLSGSSALFDAAECHHQGIVEYLLSHGAEINLRDDSGWTPLLRALQRSGGDDIVRVLVTSGADVNVRDKRGYSPLHIAVAQKKQNIVELILANGGRVE